MDTNKTVLTEQQRTEIFERHFSHDHPKGADIGRVIEDTERAVIAKLPGMPADEDITVEMIQAGANAAREYYERTGGNSPGVIYKAMRAVAPRILPAASEAGAEPFAVDARALVPRLQSLLDRMANDDRTATMFEADGDTLRDAIRLLRGMKRYAPPAPVQAGAVPSEPTVDMIDAACMKWAELYPSFEGEKPSPTTGDIVKAIYRAMIEAAPPSAPAAEPVPQSEAIEVARALRRDWYNDDYNYDTMLRAAQLLESLPPPAAESAEPKGGDGLRTFLNPSKDAGITHLPNDFAEKLAAATADAQGDERAAEAYKAAQNDRAMFSAKVVRALWELKEQYRIAALSRQPSAAASVPSLLAADHKGMKVDYSGMLGQAQNALGSRHPGVCEMLRQFQGHLEEMGRRWYAGDMAVVDELLQLYCVEEAARAALAAAKQGDSDA